MKKLFVSAICLLFAYSVFAQKLDSAIIVKWINENSISMEKTNDLAYKYIDSIAKNKKIIGMGEPVHSSKTIYEKRNEIAKHLIEKNGYNIIAIELGYNIGLRINDYVLNGKGNIKELVSQSHFFINCQEYIDFFEWIKNYNTKATKKVTVWGFDNQNNFDLMVDLEAYLKKTNKQACDSVQILYKIFQKDGLWQFNSYKKSKRDSIQRTIKYLAQNFESNKADYIKKSDIVTYEQNKYRVTALQNQIKIIKGNFWESFVARDSCNARLIDWICQSEGAESKAILFGHNGHLGKTTELMPVLPSTDINCMRLQLRTTAHTGFWLKEIFGKNYYFIGFQFGHGNFYGFNLEKNREMMPMNVTKPENPSLNWSLAKAEKKCYYLPIEIKRNTPEIIAYYLFSFQNHYSVGAANDTKYNQTSTKEFYDAIIYYDEIEASACYEK